MMDLEGGQTSKRDDEKPMEGLSRHLAHLHHSLNLNKVIIWMTVLVIAADVFIVLYRSGYPNPPSLPTSRDSKEHSFASQVFSSGQANNVSSSSSTSSGDQSCSANRSSPNPQVDKDSEKTKLERVLCKAATVDKTVIFTAANAAWTTPGSLIDLFLEGFRIGDQTISLLNHLVIVAMDQKAYSRCLEVHHHCYALATEGVNFSGEAHFMSEQYLKMMWRRLDFMRTILELGYNFIFTDSDILWLRNPFPRFYEDADFQIASDEYRFNSTDPNNKSNAGFIYVRSNNKTLQFYNFWYWSKETYPGKNEQDVFNRLKKNPFISEIGLKMRFLDTQYFSGFCQPSKDLNVVCTMHANCCYGIRNKIHDLQRVIDDWRDYRESPRNSTNPYPWGFAKKDLKLHIVHRSSSGGIAVVGILYEIGRPDSFLAKLLHHIKRAEEGDVIDLGVVSPGDIKFGSRKYYRYIGSLTVPPCTEGVLWTIVKKVRTVSREQIRAIRDVVHDGFEANARPLQQENGRQVYLYHSLIHLKGSE